MQRLQRNWNAATIAPKLRPTSRPLDAFAITDRPSLLPSLTTFWALSQPQTVASADNLLGVFRLTNNTEEPLQGLDAELANGPVERL